MRQFEQAKTVSGNSPYTLHFPEAASQTFEVGAPVVLNASGQVLEATSPVTSLVGIAGEPATGVTGTSRLVWIANDDTRFAGVMAGAVQADIKGKVNVVKTGALWALDRTAAGHFQVDEIGTLPNGQKFARGRFLEDAAQLSLVA